MSRSLSDLGESELIAFLSDLLPSAPGVRIGIGDDAAVVAGTGDRELVLTSDAVIEGVHFTPEDPAGSVGHKTIARVLSDFAAMGADPAWGLIDLVAPGNQSVDYVESLYRGVAATSSAHGFHVVGGDCARGEPLSIHCFGAGTVPPGRALPRSGVCQGDILFVTGELGGSGAGGHLSFAPRLREGRWLRESGMVTSMIDVSDGLATDATHLARAGGVVIEVRAADLPASKEAQRAVGGRTKIEHVLYDGEDFELLFTVCPDAAADLLDVWSSVFSTRLTGIGHCGSGPDGVVLVHENGSREELAPGGFDHFS